jgi:hypothetical protein
MSNALKLVPAFSLFGRRRVSDPVSHLIPFSKATEHGGTGQPGINVTHRSAAGWICLCMTAERQRDVPDQDHSPAETSQLLPFAAVQRGVQGHVAGTACL